MKSLSRLSRIVLLAAAGWIAVMGMVYVRHYGREAGKNLAALSSDVTAEGEARRYYIVYRGAAKAGYLIASRISLDSLKVLREELVLKVNMAGLSREVFIQSTASVDSASMRMQYSEFRLQSGTHTFLFNSSLHEDSLLINVRMNDLSPWRRGAFIVSESILPEVVLPFRLRYSGSAEAPATVFDPVLFAARMVEIGEVRPDTLSVAGEVRSATRFALATGDETITTWVDSLGWVVREEGVKLFGDVLGEFTIEESTERDVFYLPVETTLGRSITSWTPSTGGSIPDPRRTGRMEVRLDGVRGATVDTGSSNTEIISMNPLVLAIHNRPVAAGSRLMEIHNTVAADTSLLGTSDYIQSADARIARTASEIRSASPDTLAAARAIVKWVHSTVRKDTSVVITRSVDVLRDRRGGPDEHTKLFTALARSIGIPTQINLGLVYDDGAFRYHSWPAVFAGGVWHDMDPWYGQESADAARVALVRGDFDRLPELFRMTGVLSLKIITHGRE